MLLVKLLINSKFLVVKFWGSHIYTHIFDCLNVCDPNPHVLKGSTTVLKKAIVYLLTTDLFIVLIFCYFPFFIHKILSAYHIPGTLLDAEGYIVVHKTEKYP